MRADETRRCTMIHEEALHRLNRLPPDEAERELLTCCGSQRWAARMAESRPFATLDEVLDRSDEVWWALDPADWLEAFRSHPRIGERTAEARQSEREAGWSRGEQAGVDSAAADTRHALAEGNAEYERRFGHIFIVCASGLSAEEMLGRLERRLGNDAETEMGIAAEEQRRIAQLRLRKMVEGG